MCEYESRGNWSTRVKNVRDNVGFHWDAIDQIVCNTMTLMLTRLLYREKSEF